ncbi:MAG TPA: PEP-CTERM sorting domain-containing protein [Planctomycetota bacterium]|nr:PEP-CTERM sorting domain-containing protein [Planctomycetota bacterium]
MRNLRSVIIAFVLCVCCASVFGAPVYITGVPDWDQPVIAGAVALGAGWDAWCVPSSASNIMGYYRDGGVTNLIGDGSAFDTTAAWPAGDWQDDGADPVSSNWPAWPIAARNDIGYFMNTNDFGETAVNPGGGYKGTSYNDVKPGLDGLTVGFTGYFPASGQAATVTNAAVNAALNTAPGGPFTVGTVWGRLTAEIDDNRPMIVSFSHGGFLNRQQVRGAGPAGLADYDFAIWMTSNPGGDTNDGSTWEGDLGHACTLVGYWPGGADPTHPFYNDFTGQAPNAIIVHDNRDGYLGAGGLNPRGLPLVLPFDGTCPWVMNTEIVIPEPTSVTLVLLGSAVLAVLRRRRRS